MLSLDVTVLADAGNAYDVMFMAARAALWDTKVPRTRGVQYTSRKGAAATTNMDVDEDGAAPSGFDTRRIPTATDFELPDYWDEGEVLQGRESWPVCVTLNIVSVSATGLRELPSSFFAVGPPSIVPRRNIRGRSCDTIKATVNVFFSSIIGTATTGDALARPRGIAAVANKAVCDGT